MKISRLGLVVVVRRIQQTTTSNKQRKKTGCLSTTNFELPEELPSVEEALKILVAAMNALETPDLSKTEVLRLRSIIQAAGVY